MALRGRQALKTWLVALLALAGLSLGLSVSFAAVAANPTPVCANSVCTVTFTAGNAYTYSPPAGTALTITVKGGAGGKGGNDSQAGAAGKYGDTVSFQVTADGSPISIFPGGAGGDGANGACGTGGGSGGASAYGGGKYLGGTGGNAGPACSSGAGGGGGAASVVTISSVDYVAAGGAGGGGGDQFCSGPVANAYALANSTANTFGAAGSNGTGDGSGAGGGGGGYRAGNGGGMGSCSTESLGYGGYSGLSYAPAAANATTTVAANAGAGAVTVSYPDRIAVTLAPSATAIKTTSLTYTATFGEAVTGLTASDFQLSGTATGCSVTNVSTGTTTYTITISGCAVPAGSKTLILTLPSDAATGSASRGNIAVTAATVTLDDQAPTVTLSAPSPVAQTANFDFTVTGSEALTGFDVSDFTLSGGTCAISSVDGSGATWLVHVTGCTNGNVTTLTLKAASITDLAGNAGPATAKTLSETLDIPNAPAVLTNATLSGTTSNGAEVGDTLTVSGATFSPADHGNVVYNTLTYVWYRCYATQTTASSSVASDCQAITGATAATYKLTQNDIGYYIRGAMVATNATGTVFSASSNSPVVREYDPLSTGEDTTCVVKEGLVYCWGLNNYGQAGNGTTVDVLAPSAQPVKKADGNNLTNVVSVDTSYNHSCALTNQGAMYCWGINNYYQLGDGTNVNKSVATAVSATTTGSISFNSGVVAISIGDNQTCAVKAGGSLYCWGYNNNGQLGDGTVTARTTPNQVLTAASTPLTGVTNVSIDTNFGCALVNTSSVLGQVDCWGYNGHGELGDGTVTTRYYAKPAMVGSNPDVEFSGVTDISVGMYHACAVQRGAALCWGYNGGGNLGTGNTTNASNPIQVIATTDATPISFSSGVTDVEVGENNLATSCFLKSTGALYCVGQGTTGQLTNGAVLTKSTPVASTMFMTGTTDVSIGDLFTCAIDGSGLSCVGSNTNGQLGNGTTTNSTTSEVVQPNFALHLGSVDEAPVAGGSTETGYAGTGQVLTGATTVDAATGSWFGYPLPALSYQWWSCASTGAETTTQPTGCTAISGATSLTYTPVAGDVGKFLRFEVIGTNSAGVTGDWSATTAAVGVAPSNTALPSIALKAGSAGAIVGTQAVGTSGSWSGNPTPTSSFIWYRCASSAASSTLTAPTGCQLITDATGSTYTFTASDVGYYVRGVEVGVSTAGINYAYTATVGPVIGSRVIAAGYNHTCVIRDGYVYCWGYNGYGQLGDGTTTSTNSMPATPIKLGDGTYLKNVLSIDASANTTCALTTAGAMYCWGYNGYGEIGDNTTTNRSLPTPVTGLSSGVSYIATGIASTCAVKTDGSLYCWGYNANGQLGDNTSTQRNTPVQVITAAATPITNVIQVTLGWQHTCAIKVGGALFCWGYNGNGMVGDNTTSARWMPTAVSGMSSGVTDVSAGYYYTCAVKNGGAWCWGYNANGQLGDGTATQRLSPVAVSDTTASPAISMASGVTDVEANDYDPGYTCFVKQSQKVYCTGYNVYGQLGTNNTTDVSKATAPTLFPGNVTGEALGRYHTCLIMDSKVSCLGYNINGELANGANTSTSTTLSTQTAFGNPTGALDVLPVSGGATVTGYSGTGQTLTGATTLDPITGTWYGYSYPTLSYQWFSCTSTGTAASAKPGDCTAITGATSSTYVPVAGDVGKFLRYEVIGTNSAGATLAFSATTAAVGVAPTNTVLPALALNAGSAGTIVGTSATATAGTWSGTPTPSSTFTWMRCVSAVASASTTSPTGCVIIGDATGASYTFTQSDVGSYVVAVETSQSSSGINYAYTASVGPVQESKILAAGNNHFCAIKLGLVYCWGSNANGQLGDGTTTSRSTIPTTPVKLADGSYLKNVVSIAAKQVQTCAVTTAGALYCWGFNNVNQLGDGTTTTRTVATPVSGMSSGVVGVAVGVYGGCAIKTGGTLWCWGSNGYGIIGDNTTTARPTPVQVLASVGNYITGVTQVSLGGDPNACAIKAGALYCWGYNGYGNLGDGTTTNHSMPTAVPGMGSNVTDVASGDHTCAVKNGATYCWGWDNYGQQGDGTTTLKSSPVAAINSTSTPAVPFSSGVFDVETSDSTSGYSCLIKQSQSLYCAGYNGYGQLGNGLTTSATTFTASTLFTGKVTAVALASSSTCAIVDGKIACIGLNTSGELANGTTTNTSTTLSTQSGFGTVTGALDVAPVAGGATYTGYTGVDQVLTGATTLNPLTGTWVGFAYPTLTYQWLRCASSGAASATVPADCKQISGANSITYTAAGADVGKYLRFEVIGTNLAGSAIAVSATGSNTVGLAPANTSLPSLTDTDGGYAGVIPGVVETVSSGSWSGTPAPSVSYTWYRCLTSVAAATMTDPANGDCWAIDSATAKTYTLTASDVGYFVRGVEVALSSSGIDYAYTETTNRVHESDSIAAGDTHACAIRLGRVYCWGNNSSGQLGDGTTTNRSTAVGPVKLAGGSILENVVTIEAQDTATCAATVDGSMYCWGTQGSGEFGDGVTTETTSVPKQVLSSAGNPLTGVIAIATGDGHTCVIKTNGSLWCWGYNANGQVGDGTATSRTYPVQIIASGVQQVSADRNNTCAIVNSALKCWGVNDYNQLGDGTATDRNVPTAVTNMGAGVTDVSVGYIHACAIKDGAAFCWGYNGYGQLGDGTATQRATPVQVANSSAGVVFTDDVVNIDASELNAEHSCLTKTGGVLYCFGVGGYSALANGSTANAVVPSPSTLWTTGVSEVTTGYQFTCVVKSGADFCTGYDNYGQVGNGSTTTATGSVAISAIADNAGALDVAPFSGTTTVTGTPAVGQTLTGTSTGWIGFPMPTVTYQWYNCTKAGAAASAVPADCVLLSGATNATYVPVTSDISNYVRLVATATSVAGVTTQVTAGQFIGTLPDATFIERTTAPSGFIPIGTTVTQYADQWTATPAATFTNAWYRCATTGAATETIPSDCSLITGATGTTYTTTQSDVGSYVRGAQVATNSLGTTTALAPTAGYVTETRTVAVAAQATCVIKAGEVWCAGLGTSGQLGNNTILSSSTPVKVLTAVGTSLNKVISVSGNGYHFCALTETGALYCWGQNTNGAIGNNTTTNQSMAVLISSGTTYAAVDAGDYYTCAIKVGGALYCWGLGTTGQLGDGTVVSKSVPTAITSMASGVSQVSTGWQTTCAIKNGSALCWGNNGNYQIGDGTVTNRTSPTQVTSLTSGVTDISVSTVSACAIQNGAALCWGNNSVGQDGVGTATANYAAPTQVVATASGIVFTSGVADVEMSVNNNSDDSGYITKTDGSLYVFGSQVNGVLFNSVTTGSVNKAIAATGYSSNVNEVSAGWGNVCVVKSGALGCVGLNTSGQNFNSSTTSPVTTPTAPVAFASGLGDVALAPVLVTAPSVDGTPGLTNVSPGDPGAFSANPASTLTYKWYTCTLTGDVATAVPADCAASTGTGAGSLNYTPVAADLGKYLRLAVTATNSAGSVTSVSAVSAQVTGKGDQSIVFGAFVTPTLGSAGTTVTATATSGLAVTFASVTPSVCAVTNGVVTAVAGGRCEIDATQAGDASYNSATASLEVYIDKLGNSITFTQADTQYTPNVLTMNGVASSGLTVTYTATPAAICTVSGSSLTLVNVGTCQVTATQAGTATIAAATPVVVNFAVTKATQTITSGLPGNLTIANATGVTVSPTATSGGTVLMDVVDSTICNFVNGKLVGLATGTCQVVESQIGDTKYSPVFTTFSLPVTREPNVSSVTTAVTSPTNLATQAISLTFDTSVTGLTASDLSTTPAACTVSSVTGSGTNYTINLSNCADGQVSLRLAANSVNNGIDGPTAAYTSAVLFTVDRTAPTVVSATTTANSPTNATSIAYTVTFSEPVTDFTAADVANAGTATGCLASVSAVSTTVYTVTYASCGDGTVGVKILANGVTDLAGNTGPTSAFVATSLVNEDRTAATVSSVTTTAPAITKTSPIPYVVTFSEAVTGFTVADISTLGTATGCQVTVTAVSAAVYKVSVAACTDGTVGIKVAANSVADLAGNVSPTADSTTSLVTLDTTAPIAPTFTGNTPSATNTLPITETITFAEPVTGFTSSDLSITGTANGCQIALTAVSTTVYTASISACSDGAVGLSLAANAVTDLAGNNGPTSIAPSGVITTLDRVAPAVSSNVTSAAAFTNVTPIPFTVRFAEPVTGVTASDFATQGTATGCQVAITPVSSTVYTVGVGPCTTDGTVGVQVKAASVTDLAGNSGPAAAVSSNTVTLDTIAPDAPVLTNFPGAFTASHAISPSFTMDARFTYRCEFDGNTVACGAGTINLGTQGSPIADGTHTLKVWVTDQAGNVSRPFSQDFTIGAYQTPLTPNVPTVARPVRTELDVSWNQPTSSVEVPVVGYTLQYNIDGINWITATTITDPAQTSYQLTTARSGLEYQFRVRANATLASDSSGFSAASTFDANYMPEITNLSVASSQTVPAVGATLTLTGIDFSKGATSVSFGTTPATVVSVSNDGTSAVVAIPAATSPGTVDINVTSGAGLFQGAGVKRGAFTYLPTPVASVITHTPPTGVKVGSAPLALNATFNSGATPVYSVASNSSTICRIDNGQLVALSVGVCNYTVAAPASGNFLAFAAKSYSATLIQGDNVSSLVLPNGFTLASTPINGTPYLLAGASTAGLPVSVTAGPDTICYVDSLGLFHMVAVGACKVVTTSGSANYVKSATTTTINITKNAQTLTFVNPGEVIPGSNPAATAAAATDSDSGFLLAASANSNLPLTYTSLDPTVCDVDEDGLVTWIPNVALKPNLNTCRVSVTQAGDANYLPLAAQTITLTATHVASVAPKGGILAEPDVSGGLGRSGGKANFGGSGFGVKVTPTAISITPFSTGILIGKKTVTLKVAYKVTVKGALVSKVQACTTVYGTNTKIPVAKGGMKGKTFTATVSCKLNADAFKWFKAGNPINFDAKVVSDRRWPTTGLKVVGKESVKVGKPLYTTSKTYHLHIG